MDLKGRCLVPGLIDAHAHLGGLGARLLRFDLAEARSFEEIVRRTAERARGVRPGEWIVGRGWKLDGFPQHRHLSEATPDHPVWLRRVDGHSGLANARALDLAGISAGTGDAPGGKIGRDASGAPTGMLFEEAMDRVERLLPERASTLDEEILAAQEEAFRCGITCIHDACVDSEVLGALLRLEAGGRLRLRVHGMFWDRDQKSLAGRVRAMAPSAEPGRRVSLRAIKIFMDGSLGSNTAWMLDPEGGVPRLSPADLGAITEAGLERGWQVCTHAIGTRANREVLGAYERALRARPTRDHRLRIEHAQHVDPADLGRFAAGGVIASVQPSHAVSDRAMCEDRLSARVLEGSYAWRSLARRGTRLALGSDAPVERLDPRWTFDCAVERGGWRTGEALSRAEALEGLTLGAAYAGFMEGERGRIFPGGRADFTLLSHDWLERGRAMESEVLLTVSEGEVVYSAPEYR